VISANHSTEGNEMLRNVLAVCCVLLISLIFSLILQVALKDNPLGTRPVVLATNQLACGDGALLPARTNNVTRILDRMKEGDSAAAEHLLPLVYDPPDPSDVKMTDLPLWLLQYSPRTPCSCQGIMLTKKTGRGNGLAPPLLCLIDNAARAVRPG
jgi:hypothetical protein